MIHEVSSEVREILRDYLLETKKLNDRFSLRAMAQKLNLPVSFLSDFLNGKKELTGLRAQKIISNLSIVEERKIALLNKVNSKKEVTYNVIDSKNYHIVEDPNYYALLCLVELDDFISSISYISERLNISEDQAKNILYDLLNLGYLYLSHNGEIQLKSNPLATGEGVPNEKLRLRHESNLHSAIRANHNLPIDKKFFNFETLAIDVKDIDKFKKLAIDFLDQVYNLSNTSCHKNAVYEFNVNFFPRVESHEDSMLIRNNKGDIYVS